MNGGGRTDKTKKEKKLTAVERINKGDRNAICNDLTL